MMKEVVTKLMCVTVAAVVLSIADGCGGGNGSSQQPSKSTVTLRTMNDHTLQNAMWVGFQDGSGTWTRLTPNSLGSYSALVKSPTHKYTLAVVAVDGGVTTVHLYSATTDEVAQIVLQTNSLTVTGPTVSGTLTAPNSVDSVGVYTGFGAYTSFSTTPPATYQTTPTTTGATDIVAFDGTTLSDRSGIGIDKMLIYRGAAINANYTQNLNFTGPDAFSPLPYKINFTGGSPLTQFATSQLNTANGTVMSTTTYSATSVGFALPMDKRSQGDVYIASVASSTAPAMDMTTVSHTVAFTNPVDLTIALPAQFVGTVMLTPAVPYSRYQASWSPWPNASLYRLTFDGDTENWDMIATKGWLGGAATFTMPDLTAVAGWSADWSKTGTSDSWQLGASAVTGNLSLYLSATQNRGYTAGMDVVASYIQHTP